MALEVSPHHRGTLLGGQTPYVTVLTCSDSRVSPELIFDEGLGEIFVIRVAGNVADPVTIGSVEYGCEHLGTPLLVILGHEKCGAVTAACSGNTEFAGSVGDLIKYISPVVAKAKAQHPEDFVPHAINDNILLQMRTVLASPVIAKLVAEGHLKVVPAVYSLTTGQVTRLKK
eukprot:TRINITY_DN2600_c0_g1_i16.p1 TRINITY_DN2600_c0_g1~~TRINITY_DN2600_c0_g1_i16.p1  ORF type:complete len:172 (-),score=27.07 TRINITY_DN2600_c0_g1_i16:241-756(-)